MAEKKGSKDSCIVNIQKCTISTTSGQKKKRSRLFFKEILLILTHKAFGSSLECMCRKVKALTRDR